MIRNFILCLGLLLFVSAPVYADPSRNFPPAEEFLNTDLQNQSFGMRDLRGARFLNVDIEGGDFDGADLRGAVFANVDFNDVSMRGANLEGAEFKNVNFNGGDLHGVFLEGASFKNVNFNESTNLLGVDFNKAHLTNVSFADAVSSSNVSKSNGSRALNIVSGENKIQLGGGSGNSRGLTIQSGENKIQLGRGNDDVSNHKNIDLSNVVSSVKIAETLKQAPVDTTYHTQANINLAILFEMDSAVIKGVSWGQLHELSKALLDSSLSDSNFLIEGHTDSKGSDAYNMDLSYKRAFAVRTALVDELKVDPRRLEVKGYGESRSVASNEDDSGRAQNRRVTIVNLGKR